MTEPPRSATAMSGVQGLLALQETSSESLDRAALTNAEMLLDALGALQAGRVGDASTGSAASRIERLLGEATPPADPRLGELLRQVALRARIELWRQRSTQSA